ncbi:lipase family protein [Bacillus sp. FJAT-45350]|uniref:lipase family protein n=1 Tax=Bacillus sp. FJAT-45350 TaxID=2011014 RepID=UPI000BB845B3|nr:lipase family protein [Bacillus sp. FJAT-45350]
MKILPYFNKKLALSLLDICNLTYKQYKHDGYFHVPDGFRLVQTFKGVPNGHPEWFGFILESNDAVITAFRGTQSDTDWIADCEVFQNPYPYTNDGGHVHHGFLSIYDSCRDVIMRTYETLSKEKNLYITGHSLGAAIATLHALDVSANSPFKETIMYNYGSPRVGNKQFSEKYNSFVPFSIRYVNTEDIVPMVPPRQIYCPFTRKVWDYKHVNESIDFTIQTGSIRKNHYPKSYRTGIESLS